MDAPGDDDPMTLDEACKVVFRGAIKPATLLAEARRGRLVIERVGRRNFVTRTALKEMRDQCRVPPKVLVSGTIIPPDSGTSATDRANAALDALLESGRKQKKPLSRISPKDKTH